MNLKTISLLVSLLVALVISSCAPPGPMVRQAPKPGVSDVATSGNRSGDFAITGNTIDAILNNPERPGLATGWGDAKQSNIRFVSFKRSSSKPAGVDRIYYNDKKGIELMTRNPRKVEGLQKAAGGLVEWGIKSGWGYATAYKDYGMTRRFVVGKAGRNYSIVVKNLSDSPLEIVCSVDGLDVQDGKSAA